MPGLARRRGEDARAVFGAVVGEGREPELAGRAAGQEPPARRVAAALLRLREQDDDLDAEETTFEIKIDQTTLARYAGLTRSNLNRVLKRFERAGASRHEKGVLKIFDMEWLEDFALSED